MKTTINDKITEAFGEIDWVRPNMGYMVCPGEEYHSTPSGHKDCAIYLDKVPTIFCLHASCRSEVVAANTQLRDALRDDEWTPKKLTREQRERISRRKDLECKERHLAGNKEIILEKYHWPVAEIAKSSPTPITDEWSQFCGLFDDDDILWCGEPYHSGSPQFSRNFQPKAHWSSLPEPPHHFVCGSTFQSGTHCRSKSCVKKKVAVIVECDSLHVVPEVNKDLSGAVLKYITDIYGWKLRCIIDSGNRSLHGHFDHPGDDAVLWANVVLPALNVDTGVLGRETQPVRAPGVMRDNGQPQRLLWIR